METTGYRAWEKRRQEREGVHRGTQRRRGVGTVALGPREKRRLVQLFVCVVLFLAVFVGKGVLPTQMETLRTQVLQTIGGDTDFKAAFSSMGHAISAGEPVMNTLEGLWVDVFGGGTATVSSGVPSVSYPGVQAQAAFLWGGGAAVSQAEHWLGRPIEAVAPPVEQPVPVPLSEPPPATVPTVEHMPYDGPALPTNATMDKYNLGAVGVMEIATPAVGQVTSDFGWREHPVEGGEKFHNGVDLAVNNGTEIGAFADGVVEYVGDDPSSYGKYLKINHAGGVSTFYAHCNALLVTQGQAVKVGQTVAQSGDTGNATGPHLHFEIKLGDQRINPLYYIETA